MPFKVTEIEGLLLFEPKIFQDERGYFFESFNKKTFDEVGISREFVQDNQSFSTYGTVRGLHLQKGSASQAKLVRVTKGKVLDVVVDLRKNSKTFGMHLSFELSEENQMQLYVPRDFAHGFVVLSEDAIFQYKVDNFYSKENELGIIYNDPDLNIDWKILEKDIKLSKKDEMLLSFKSAERQL